MKQTKQEMVYAVLQENANELMTVNKMGDILFDRNESISWFDSVVTNAAYRSIAKGLPVEAVVEKHTLMGFRYIESKPTMIQIAPNAGTDPDMDWSPLDNAVDRITDITKPADKTPDLFDADDDLLEIVDETLDVFTQEIEPPVLTPEQEKIEAEVGLPMYHRTAKYLHKHDYSATKSPITPEATTSAVMHYITSCKPMTITASEIREHFNVSKEYAVQLLIDAGKEYSQLKVEFNITAVAL